MIVPSKLRLICLLSVILDKIVVRSFFFYKINNLIQIEFESEIISDLYQFKSKLSL
jgi:hypothetical protein